jgi:autotransporter translocation and assembly factor TamB
MADKQTIQREDGKVFEVRNIHLEIAAISAKYEISVPGQATFGPTGEWTIFEIRHKSGSHTFRGRWDEKGSEIDVDLLGLGNDEAVAFKRSKHRSSGHHTTRQDSEEWKFKLSIVYKGIQVLDGVLTFELLRKVGMTAGMSPWSGSLETRLIRNSEEK